MKLIKVKTSLSEYTSNPTNYMLNNLKECAEIKMWKEVTNDKLWNLFGYLILINLKEKCYENKERD